jgi:hypothetical protein
MKIRIFENARVTVEVPEGEEEKGTGQPLLFSVTDLETALTELHYGQAHEIASRICKSLVPYDGNYTIEELCAAYQETRGCYGWNGTSGEETIRNLFALAHKNRMKRSHES